MTDFQDELDIEREKQPEVLCHLELICQWAGMYEECRGEFRACEHYVAYIENLYKIRK